MQTAGAGSERIGSRSVPSDVMQALYEGRREDAEALAAGRALDVFEAAALGDHPRLAELLQNDGDLVRAWSDDGFTALHYACFFGTLDCTIALADAGALLDEPSRNAMAVRPINSAAAGVHPYDNVRVLLARGADVDGCQASGHTALDEARRRGDQALVDLLIQGGALG
jgi:ankyrin repeat protein